MRIRSALIIGFSLVACTPRETPAIYDYDVRVLRAGHAENVVLEQGRPLFRRLTIRLSAEANASVEGGLPRVATATVDDTTPCVSELDGGSSCFFDRTSADGGTERIENPARVWVNGDAETPLFEGCPADVDCEESVLVEIKLVDENPRTVGLTFGVAAEVFNAGFQRVPDGLTVIAQ